MSETDARRRARLEFGGLDQVREACRDVKGLNVIDAVQQDVHYACRTFVRNPAFAVVATLTVALGVGATTAAFSITDRVLIRPLPFVDSARLVKLWQTRPEGEDLLSPANFRDWKRLSRSFESIAAYQRLSANLTQGGDPTRVEGVSVTADLFPALGVKPSLGRAFSPEDDREGVAATLILSYGLWQSQFGGDVGVLGRRVLLDDQPYVVIGVMPRSFSFPTRDAEIWTAIRLAERDFQNRADTHLECVARLRAGISVTQARTELQTITAQLEREYPRENADVGAAVTFFRDEVSDRTRSTLLALFGAAACVLLIGCSNLANLLLARSLARRSELSVRSALGAGRARLVQQLLTETMLLVFGGGALGIVLATGAAPRLVQLIPQTLPIEASVAVDMRVLAFAVCLTLVTGLIFGVIPALKVSRDFGGLQAGPRVAGGPNERLHSALVIAEVAASVVLLVLSALFIRALWRLQAIDPGFRSGNVLTLRTPLPMPRYRMTQSRVRFYTQVLSGVRSLPGVSHAAYVSFLPMVFDGGVRPITIDGQTNNSAEPQLGSLRYVTPGYFATLGIPLLAGRDVSESDTTESPFAAVVSQSFVRKFWANENPIGRLFTFGSSRRLVVGVVRDVRFRGLEKWSEPQVYLPISRCATRRISFMPQKISS
jgi:putative ABC transport system permease protein